MFDEIRKKIIEAIESDSGFEKSISIKPEDFREIKKLHGKSIAFIDGGNAEIMGSSNFSLSLVRIGYVVYKNNKKISSRKFEFFVFSKANSENGKLKYSCSLINSNLDLKETDFDSFDNTLASGANRADIKNTSNAIRRFAELRVAEMIAGDKIAEIIVMDGNLKENFTGESIYLKKLSEACLRNDVLLAALSKTNDIFFNGMPFSVLLEKKSSKLDLKKWYYMSNDVESNFLFAKLNEKSNHVFKIEVMGEQMNFSDIVISNLAQNSSDPVFLGYPFGLIEADRISRVSNQERSSLKSRISSMLRSRQIEKYLSTSNAHEILDRISF